MENDKIIRMITEKCDVYYDDALLSKEKILEKYLLFFAKQINSEERTVSFAFHTGSLCFDAASVVAVVIGCLAYGFPPMMKFLPNWNRASWFCSEKKDIVGWEQSAKNSRRICLK